MEKRQIKRLLILVALSIVIIMALKKVLTETAVSLNKAVAEKKQAPAQPQATVELPTVDLPAGEPPAVQLEPVHFPPEPAEPPTEYVEMSPASADSDTGRIESKTADAPAARE